MWVYHPLQSSCRRDGSLSFIQCKPAQNQDLDMISEAMDKNIAESVIWPETDILITTPKILYRIL